MTAVAKALGASWGRLCPMPPMMVRCAYLPENFLAYAAGSGCGAPLASPSRVMVGTVMTGASASRLRRPRIAVEIVKRCLLDIAVQKRNADHALLRGVDVFPVDLEVFARAGGLVISGGQFFNSRSKQLAAMALRYAVPTISPYVDLEAGGLMSYGASITDVQFSQN